MNLCLRINGESYNLWQTPTHVTYMCLMTSKGVKPVMSGKQALRALQIYFEWCEYSCHVVHIAKEHIEDVTEAIKDADIEVYMM
jgi:hypothetical protein